MLWDPLSHGNFGVSRTELQIQPQNEWETGAKHIHKLLLHDLSLVLGFHCVRRHDELGVDTAIHFQQYVLYRQSKWSRPRLHWHLLKGMHGVHQPPQQDCLWNKPIDWGTRCEVSPGRAKQQASPPCHRLARWGPKQ